MLEPQDRAILLDALRPPDGYVLDQAIATTYTLDLTALLTAPLAFSLYGGLMNRERGKAGEDAVSTIDPYALLRAVREHAERITVFCQTGRIAAPKRYQRLLAYLEPAVVQVRAVADGGAFHPKVWVLRFTRTSDEAVRYRVLFLSRNLTFDRSWDTILTLDGDLTDRTRAFADNHPLGDFIQALPGLALGGLEAKRRRAVARMADEVRRVRFELPEHVDALKFHPLGIEGYGQWPFEERLDRMLVISPFVTDSALAKLAQLGRENIVVSCTNELQSIRTDVLDRFKSLYVLDPGAELEDEGESESSSRVDPEGAASGLHAKIYVADQGWNAHVWTGSANATTAGFELNVEFLVQLTGKKSRFGVDAFLDGPDGSSGIRPLLASFVRPPAPIGPSEVERRLEQRLNKVRDALSRARWVAAVGEEQDGRFPFALDVHGGSIDFEEGVDVRVWPITLQDHRAVALRPPLTSRVADFGLCSFEALTSFFAFSLYATEGETRFDITFVINASLEGAPENRAGRILQSLLDEPGKVLRFLQILLATDPLDVLDAAEDAETTDSVVAQAARVTDVGLLETLLRALDRDPARIDAVEAIVNDLKSAQGAMKVFPPDFEKIWEPIRAARAAARQRGRT